MDVLKERFEADGWKVAVASDGVEALEAIAHAQKGDRFDLLLLDLLMPRKDGFAVLEEVKENPDLKSLKIIVLSNLGEDENIKKAMSLGANDYFVKTQHPMSEIVEKAKQYQAG